MVLIISSIKIEFFDVFQYLLLKNQIIIHYFIEYQQYYFNF